jgi:hypothetical protein
MSRHHERHFPSHFARMGRRIEMHEIGTGLMR